MIMSGCAGTRSGDMESCQSLANYIKEGQPTDTRVDVLMRASEAAEDPSLRARLDDLRLAHMIEGEISWDAALESVAERCLELKALQA